MAEPQQQPAEGVYPRMNEAMLSGGKYNNTIVSLVGKFLSMTSFQCCDGGIVELSGEHADIPEMIFNNNKMVVEVVGQVVSPTLVALFVVRELSEDMDLDLHNRMLAVQHNPKFASYFKRTMASN